MGRIITNQILFESPPDNTAALRQRLLPSADLQFGYMAPEEELDDLLLVGQKSFAAAHLTWEQVAAVIENLFLSDDAEVNGNPVFRIEYIHSPVCPWGDFCSVALFDIFPKVTEIIVCNRKFCPKYVLEHLAKHGRTDINDYPMLVKRDWAIILSDLHPHLLREHQFCQGVRTPYHIYAERIKCYFGI
jgi:hypothetical protein